MSLPDSISRYFALKAWPTRMIGLLLLIGASPLILLLILIVRATSPGPGLYRQTRTGRHGKEFKMYKIRTMYQDAESISGPTWCKPGDSRITPIGKILRLLHLDELPQLINIVNGEMDLIGPRPERPAFVEVLAREIPNYRDRLQVLPGVTGLAQVNLPPDETLNCVRKKLVLDRDYIRSASLSLDIRILVCTSLRMLGIRHGRTVRWFRLERDVAVVAETNGKSQKVSPHRGPQPAYQHADAVYVGSVPANGNGDTVRAATTIDDSYAGYLTEPVAVAPQSGRRPR
jgi:lipopolysaccharide/colanic/teichoic acid biosynthesis glycosyltransferase